VIAQRREGGLPIDPRSVRRAIENSNRPEFPLPGLFFTPEEEAEIEAEDDELADRAEALLIDAGAEVGGVAWCWLDGRRGVEVSVKRDVERYRELLDRELGSDRVIVKPARYSEREQRELCDRIENDVPGLAQLGIELSSWWSDETGVQVQYFAADRDQAQRLLRGRWGPTVNPTWLGPSLLAEEPQPFGSWIAEGRRLTVFYPLHHNGARPGSCSAQELPDRVIVSLTILEPQGFQTAVGGFKPAHATIELAAPLGDRTVIDAAHDLPRPEWTGGSSHA
jgi:hypothetical protein